ncbi:hypothetical protein N7537_005810 [Penicillium hordei]|uniref:Uncharacterized protein n=1 Tax=Penicillium hordei TaxID=40994 RepID=A0AAD6E7Q7_9EURO|nr:uncharacterized protein N7537_005810 [Penicillium hordei]KAJ5602854.1 hypothetical protein N7537_005810 [Penicillium hordei]
MRLLWLSRKPVARINRLDTLVADNSITRAIESTFDSALVIRQDLHRAIRQHHEHSEDYLETHA